MITKFEMLDAVADDARVSPGAFRLFYVLVTRFLNKRTVEAWPSQATLAGILNVGEKQIGRLIGELKEAGYLASKRGGSGKANRRDAGGAVPRPWKARHHGGRGRTDSLP